MVGVLTKAYTSKSCSVPSRRRFDFHTPARMDRGLELFISIHKDLVQVIPPPQSHLLGNS